ncbi:MAG: SAM-dependent methyltransferase [Planctomycetota bacterium]
MDTPDEKKFASRGGLKLDAALDHFGLDVAGATCADLGCSTGGFVDCLLQRGAARVYAVDTAYGELAWKLRQDDRVVVMERTNALHATPPETDGQDEPFQGSSRGSFRGCDLVSIDLGWTKQDRAVPAAIRWLRDSPGARIVTLVKPHYESGRHRLTDDEADDETQRVLEEVLPEIPGPGIEVVGWIRSPIRGGKGKNLEHLAVLRPAGG